MSHTLICYDGSPSARHAIQVAAHSLAHDHTLLLNVWNLPERVHADSFSFDKQTGVDDDQLRRRSIDRAQEILAEGRAFAKTLGFELETRAEPNRSSVPATVLEVADELDSDVILIGTHGSTAADRDLLGSVSQALASHSHRPVMIVPVPAPTARAAAAATAESTLRPAPVRDAA